MQRYIRIPLLFFFVAATAGICLRWHFISPLENVRYPFLLHAHSHIMFLGWIFNTFYLAYVDGYVKARWTLRYRWMFILLQILVLAMCISFPLQGYGLYSIIFSTLHTIVATVFIAMFFRDLKQTNLNHSVSSSFVKISLGFFLLSSAGPFALGFIMANGLGESKWYYLAVYFYLHFQYNGFFLFGVYALFFKLLEERNVVFPSQVSVAAYGMAITCLPAYILSTLWANPGWLFNGIGLLVAGLQIAFFLMLIQALRRLKTAISGVLEPLSLFMLQLVLGAFAVKVVLQFLSAFPYVARLAYQVRYYSIAYLHLVLIGIISTFLLVWFSEKGFIKPPHSKAAFVLYTSGFAGMELLLVAAPSLSTLSGFYSMLLQKVIFMFSLVLWVCSGWFMLSSFTSKRGF